MRGRIGYADALKILGVGHSKTLGVINRLLGGAILAGTAVTGQLELLTLLHAREELIGESEKLLAKFGQRVRGAASKSRTDLLVAAHGLVAINAYFEALADAELPINLGQLELTAAEQMALAGGPKQAESHKLVEALLQTPVPLPTPSRPFEQTLIEMKIRYLEISRRLLEFTQGLAIWDRLDETRRSELGDGLLDDVPTIAVRRYEETFRQLALDCAEFSIWMSMTDSRATRTALAGLQQILESLSARRPAGEWPTRLARTYQAKIDEPIAETSPGDSLAGLVIPMLGEGYVNPRFRVAEYHAEALPAEESWWDAVGVPRSVEWFLAGYLTSPASVDVPLVLLGQPGSGKSIFTKVLAARLLPEDYLPVRVSLRHEDGDAPVQDQIESALRRATGVRMDWPELVEAAGDVLPVVMLDGFDELLQSTKVTHSDYLLQVREFQRREAIQGRPVAVIVTSRTVVANRVRFPEGTILAKMDPFDNEQMAQWLTIWNDSNSAYFDGSALRSLPLEAVLAHRDLAEQPLLLLMLSFYDAAGNALQKQSDELGRAGLYAGLLAKFVDREVDKLSRDSDQADRSREVNKRLYQLAVVAFAMFNRGKKSATEAEINADLEQLGKEEEESLEDAHGTRIARRLTPAQRAVAEFFFVHRSQARVDEAPLREYEFLHATFGEYLVAWLVSVTLMSLLRFSEVIDQGFSPRSRSEPLDAELWELLSFTPLSDDPQAVGFIAELIGKLPDDQRVALREALGRLFRVSLRARPQGYTGYQPRRLTVPARHAAYSANLVLLNVLLSNNEELRASSLFDERDNTVEAWRSLALLWRSQLDPAGWDGLINALVVRHLHADADLEIRHEVIRLTKPLELFRTVDWLTARPSRESGSADLPVNAVKTAWQVAFLCAPELDLLLHGLQPLLSRSPRAFSIIEAGPDGQHTSIAHSALVALLDSANLSSGTDHNTALARRLLTSSRTVFSSTAVSSAIAGLTASVLGGGIGTTIAAIPPTLAASTIAAGWLRSKAPENEPFAVLKLYLADDANEQELLRSVHGLPSAEQAYEASNPMMLAKSEPSFITRVLEYARENGMTAWAAQHGLTLLAALPVDKLGAIPSPEVDHVLASADIEPANAGVIQLVRDRYRTGAEGSAGG